MKLFLNSSTLLLSTTAILVLLTPLSTKASSCEEESWLGDGFCDPECNNEENSFDKGDCCEDTCVEGSDYDCGINGYDCKQMLSNSYIYTKQYSGFELTMKCDKVMGAGYTTGYAYTLTADRNDLGRKSSYSNDPSVPDECQQQFKGSKLPAYKTAECSSRSGRQQNPFCYDRGHIVMANHMDGTSLTKTEASYVTNLVPQATGFNQAGGSWRETEDLIECVRDFPNVEKLDIFGGLIYNDDGNDYFFETHKIPTPDLYYKVVVKYFKEDDSNAKKDPDVIAWIMQNKASDRAHKLDKRFDGIDEEGNFTGDLISTTQLKRLVNDPLDRLPEKFTQSAYEAGETWDRPSDCSKGFVTSSLNDEL